MTRCCRSTSMVVTFGVSASARESKAMWVVLCVRGIRLEAEWEALDRPLAFHSNSIQPFPPCALPPLLHPRLKAPSRSYPFRQLLLHHVPRWNVHRLYRCGLWNAGASLCHHKQGGKLVCNIHTYIPSSLTYIQTGRGSPLTFYRNSIHPYSLFHAAGASSSAVCVACSPGTYSGSAGARAWARVSQRYGQVRLVYHRRTKPTVYVSYVLVSQTHSHSPVSVCLSVCPPFPQSRPTPPGPLMVGGVSNTVCICVACGSFAAYAHSHLAELHLCSCCIIKS